MDVGKTTGVRNARTAVEKMMADGGWERLRFSALGALVFGLVANGFAYLNFYPQHDAINHSLNFAGSWEVSLGRFLLPVYGAVFGNITTPWLTGLLSMLCLAGVTFLFAELFRLEDKKLIFLLAGIFSANATVTILSAVFIYVEAAYMLSWLLAMFSVFVVVKCPRPAGILAGACLLAVSLGLYQAFVSCVLVVLLFVVCRDLLTQTRLGKQCLCRWGGYLAYLIAAAAIYGVGYKAGMLYWHTTPAQNHNSISSLKDLSLPELLYSLRRGYRQFVGFFYGDDTQLGFWFVVGNLLLTLVALVLLVWYVWRKKLPLLHLGFLAVLLVVYPVVTLSVLILYQSETIYFLIAYALFLFYAGTATLASKLRIGKKTCYASSRVVRGAVLLSLALVLWQNILYSNGAYTTQKLLYDRTVSIMTRIMDEVDRTPGYLQRTTKVVFVGSLEENNCLEDIAQPYQALSAFQNVSVTYLMTYGSMARILGYCPNMEMDQTVIDTYAARPEVQQMPVYPQAGYCQYLDDCVVVKLS